jgi:hypothetical protein
VLVIDPRDFRKRTRGYLRSRLSYRIDPLSRQQRSKLDNEHEHDSGDEEDWEMTLNRIEKDAKCF